MRALLSTTQHLLHLDLDTRAVTVLQNSAPEYYGITWKPGSDGLVLSHSGVDHATLQTLEDYAHSEQGWLSFPGGRTVGFLSAPHQIQWCSDGRVVTTNTGRNRLVAIDAGRPGHFQEAGLSDGRWDRLSLEGPFGDHLNSVFEADGRLYAMAHGYAQGSRLAIFSYPELQLLSVEPVPGRTGLHNIFVGDGLRLSCHSEAAALVDLARNEILWEAGTSIYTRGLAVTDDLVLVGESARTGRDLRRSSLSGLWVLDRRTWRTVDYFPLGPFGAVNEVRVIDVPDHAHHGTPLVDPDRLLETLAYETVRTERMTRSEAAAAALGQWRDFDLALGASEAGEGGWRHGRDGLTIMTRRPGRPQPWHFDYALEPGGHLSVIADYAGHGGDGDMIAFLMQLNDNGAQLSEWHERGSGWERQGVIVGSGLPAAGRARVHIVGERFELEVDGRLLHAQDLPSTASDRLCGLRWLTASVRPVGAN